MNVLRWHRIVLAGTLCALLACTAGLIVLAGSDVGTKSATRATTRVVDRALGTHERNTSLRRNPARGLEVNITPHGFTYDAGSGGTIALSGVGIEGKAQTSYANGTLRHTSFGSEAVAVNGEKAEEFLTVDKKLGPRTWRWRLDTPLEARVSDRGWVGFFDRRTNRLMSVAMPPVKIFNSRGGDVTPAGLMWRLDTVKKQQFLTLALDDATLPSPYTIDPGAYRTNNTASSVAASGTFTLTIPATVNAKDLLLVHEAGQATTATSTFPTTPTDNTSGGNTWAQVSGTNVANSNIDQFVWWKWAISGDASSTVTVTIPASTLPTITSAVVDVYKGLDSTKAGPQTTGAVNTTTAHKFFTTPAITPSGATTQEHMIMMVAGNFNTSTAWSASVNATGGTWTVQPSGTGAGSATSESTATYDSDTTANTAYAAIASGNVWGANTNSVTSAFGFSDDLAAPSNSITITNGSGTAYMSTASGATGTLYYNGTNAGSFQLQNAVSDSQSGPGSSTFPALGGTATGWSHTAPATVSSPTGGPYNSGASPNNFSWSAGTSSSPTEAIVGSDNGGNTATTTLTFTNDTSATAPAITFPANNAHSNSGGWATISGTGSDSGSGVASDQVSIQDTTTGGSSCWKPATSDFTAACPNYITATGTTSWTYSAIASGNLTDGHAYTVTARTIDNLNNTSSTATSSFVYDTTAPTATISSPTSGTHYNSAGWAGSISGTAADSSSSVATVKLSIQKDGGANSCWDGTNAAGHFTSACPNYVTATGTTSWSANLGSSALIDGSSYAITVETIDNATNANTNTSAATATYVYDTTAPNTAALTTNGNYNGAGFPANLTGTTTDSGTGGSGISAVSISIKDSTSNKCWNGTNFTTASCPNWVAVTSGGTATGSNNANWSYSTTGMGAQLTSGDTYTIQIQATDATTSGTTSSALSAGTFTYDNTAPSSATLSSNGNYNSGGWPGAVTGTVSDSGTGSHGISAVNVSIQDSVSGKCWNGSNFTTASCPNWVAVTSGGTATGSNNASWSYTLASSALTDGHTYTVSVQATDATTNGNQSGTLSTSNFKYDTSAPSNSVSLNSATGAHYTGGTLYYKSNAAGSFTFKDTLTDSFSGPSSVTYPAIATSGWTHGAETVNAGPNYTSSSFSWVANPGANPSGYQVSGSDVAGNSASSSVTFTSDVTGPSVTAPSVTAGYYTSASVPVGPLGGTDSGSGVAPGTSQIQRDVATLSAGSCTGWTGTWSNITLVGGFDTSVANGHCYEYREQLTDNVGNVGSSAASNVAMVDTQAPGNALSLSNIAPAGSAYKSGTTIYYNGSVGGGGSLKLTNGVSDAESGPGSSATAALGGTATGWSHTPSTVSTPSGGPYVSNAFTWSQGTSSSPTEVVTGSDAAGNTTAASTLTFTNDSTAPSVTAPTVTAGYYMSASVSVTANGGSDSGSGLAGGSSQIQRDVATLSGGSCTGWSGSWTNVTLSGGADTTVTNGHCYEYRQQLTDNVGNVGSSAASNVAEVDTQQPTNSLSLSSVSPTNAALLAGTRLYYRGTAAGSLKITNAVADGESGPASSATAALGGTATGWSHTPSTVSTPAGGPYDSNTFSWSTATTSSPTEVVTAADAAGNTNAASGLTFTNDSNPPTGGALTVNGTAATGGGTTSHSTSGSFPIDARTDYSETQSATESGLSSATLSRQSASVTNNSCGTFGSPTTISGNPSQSLATGCYLFTLTGTDNLGNSTSVTTTVVVDTSAPSAPSLSVSNVTGNAYSSATSVWIVPTGTGSFDLTAGSSDADTGISSYTFPSAASMGSGWSVSGTGATRTYSFGSGAAEPATKSVTATNGAGGTSSSNFTVSDDGAAPTTSIQCNGAACSTSYYTSAVSVTLTADDGTGSGVQAIRYTTDGSTPTLSNGTDYTGAFNVSSTATVQFRSYDNLGNEESTGSQDILFDGTPPTGPTLTLSENPASGAQYVSGTTLYYRPGGGGTFRVSAATDDPETGIASVDFPSVANVTGGGTLSGTPYRMDYTWGSSTTDSASHNVTATNGAGASSSASFTLTPDSSAPSGQSITLTGAGAPHYSGAVSFSLGDGSDSGSGLDTSTRTVTRESASLSGDSCGTFTADSGTFTSPDNTVTGSHCYRYSFTIADNVGNVSSAATATAKVDTGAPANAITVTNNSPAGSAYKNAATVYYNGNVSGGGSFKLANAVTDNETAPASSTTAALGGTSTGWSHTASAVSTPAGGPYVSNAFAWLQGTSSSPTETVTGTDAAGNTAQTALTFTNDVTGPSVVAPSVTAGYYASLSVGVTPSGGTDSGSGVATGTSQIQRDVATLANGSCGSFSGSWTNVTLVGGFDTGVVSGHCYEYREQLTDNVGNVGSSVASNVAKVDTNPPTNSLALSGASPSGSSYKNGTTVYYNGNVSGGGSFALTNTVADAESGPASSATASLGGTSTGWSHTASTVSTPAGGPYVSNAFSWAQGTSSSPTETVTGADAAGNTAQSTLTFTNDVTGPSVTASSVTGGYYNTTSVPVTANGGSDSGSGLAAGSSQIQRDVATLANGGCGSFSGSWTNVTLSGGVDSTVTSGHCYEYREQLTDNVGNVGSSAASNIAKVDTNAPTNSLTLSSLSPAGSAFKSGTTIYYNGDVTGGGSFALTNTLADAESGVASSTTAALGGAYGGTLYLDGPQSAVDSSSYQLTPGTPPSQGAAPSAAVGPAGGISGTFTYVYVANDGSGHYVASAPSNQLSLSNAKATITGVPAGADLYRQKGGLNTPSTPWQLVASNVPGGAYTDTTADPVTGGPAVLPGADTRTPIGAGATGAADFIPGANPPVLNSTVVAWPPAAPTTCKGWLVDTPGGVSFPAGPWTVQARVRSGSSPNGQAVLSAAMYVVDSSGSIVSTVFGPTDGAQQIQNVGTAGIVASVNGTSSSATTIGAAQHLCVHFWRHQTTGYTSGGSAARTISIVAYDPSNEISAHPAPTISGWSHTPSTVSTPAGGPFVSNSFSWAQGTGGSPTEIVTGTDGASNNAQTTLTFANDVTAPSAGALTVNGIAASAAGTSSTSSTGSFPIDVRTDYAETQTSTQSGLASSTLTRAAATLSGNSCGTFGSPVTISGSPAQTLANGCYLFTLTGTDNVGNTVSVSTTVEVDTTAPSSTLTDPGSPVRGSVSLGASASDSETGVQQVTFQYAPAGTSTWTTIGTDSSSPYSASWDTTGVADGLYDLRVVATDLVGNSAPSATVANRRVDNTAPDTSITAHPSDPSNNTAPSFSFASTETGSSFECRVDGGSWTACTSPDTLSPALSDGSHTFDVRATDQAGNTDATPATYTWTVDTAAPNTSITAQPSDPSNNTTPSLSFSSTETGSTFECRIDGGSWSPCSSPDTLSPALSDGSHTFDVRATDQAGNTDATPASYTWTVDTAAPNTSITAQPSDPSNNTTPSFSFSSTESGSSFECRIDGGSWSPCSSPDTLSPALSDGSHTFGVRATDQAGNTDATPASYTWTVDTAAPNTSITASPPDPSNDANPTFSFTSTETGSTFECRIDGGSWTACTSPDTLSSALGAGSHTFDTRATDQAGNTDATPATYTWTIDFSLPNTSIDSSPSDPSNEPNPTFDFSSNQSPVTFQCRLDGSAWTACTSPDTLAPALAEGSHSFDVRAKNQAGNDDPSPATYTWTVDLTSPTVTITAPTTYINSSDPVSYTVTASTPDSDVARVDFYECSDASAACSTGTWNVFGTDTTAPYSAVWTPPVFDGTKAIRAVAVDQAGNTGTHVRTITIDRTPPQNVTVTYPNGYVSGSFSITTNNGTSSDVDTSTALLERASSTLTNDTCSSFGGWSNATSPDTVTSGNCAKYRYTIADNAGNVTVATSANVVKSDSAAPTSSISDPGTDLRGTISLSAAANDSGGSGIDSVAFQHKPSSGGAWTTIASDSTSPYSVSFDTTSVVDGLYDFRAVATDLAGNTEASPVVVPGKRIDNTPPNATILSPGNPVHGTVSLTSSTSDGGSGVATVAYEIAPHGGAFASQAATWDTTGVPDGSYDLRVIATDAAGNTTTSSLITTRVDNTPPSLTFSSPASNANVAGTVSLVASASDASPANPAVSFEYKLHSGSTWTATSASWNTATLPSGDGLYDLRASATDAAGNATQVVNTNILVDNVPPTISITAPPMSVNASYSSPTPFTATANDTGSGVNDVQFLECSDASTDCSTGTFNALGTIAAPGPYSVNWTIPGDGNRALEVVATDNAGHSSSSIRNVNVDTTPPDTTITAKPADPSGGTVSFSFTANEPGSTFECEADGGAWSPCSNPTIVNGLTDGLHTVQIRAIDPAGNADPSPASWTWHRDSNAPTAVMDDPGRNVRATVSLTSSVNDPTSNGYASGLASATYQYSADGTTWATIATLTAPPLDTASWDTTAVADGVYQLRVIATDVAGNAATSTPVANVRIDNTPPSTSQNDPGPYLRGTVTLGGSAADGGSGIDHVDFQSSPAGANTWSTVASDTTSPYSVPFDTTSVADGHYDLRTVAVDVAGNQASSTPVTNRLVDNTSPNATMNDPSTAGGYVRGTITLTSSTSDPNGSNGSGIASVAYEYSTDGGSTWDAASSTLNTTTLPDGSLKLHVVATDSAGNVTTSGAVTDTIDNTKPVTTDDAPSGYQTADVTVHLSASDSGSGINVTEYSVDGGPYTTGTSVTIPAPADGSNDGAHTIAYFSADNVGNIEQIKSAQVLIDATPPTCPTCTAGDYLRGTVTLSASPTTGPSGVKSVEFQYAPHGTTTWTTIGTDTTGPAPYTVDWDTTAVGDGHYDLQIIVTDNADLTSTTTLADKVVDNTPPSVSTVGAPTEGAIVAGTVHITASAADLTSPIASVGFSIRGTLVQTDTSAPYSYDWDSTTGVDGPAQIQVVVTDMAGNSLQSAIRTVTVDNNAPSPALADPGQYLHGTVVLTATSDPDTAQVDFQRAAAGSGTWVTIATDTSAPYSASLDTTTLTDGLYDFRVVATDGTGNTGTSPERQNIRVDNTAPSGSLTAPASGVTVGGNAVHLATSASDAGSGVASVRYEMRATGGGSFSTVSTATTSPFGGTWDTTGLSSGSYDLRPVITDNAGNSFTGSTVTVTVNATAPAVLLADPGASVSGTVTLTATVTGSGVTGVTFSVSPAGANTWQTLGTDTTAPYSYGVDTTSLTDGLYDFRAVVTDSFGNTSASVRASVRVDNTAPRVVSSTPADAATASAVSSVALVTSEAATPSGVILDGVSTVAPVVSGTHITYNTGALSEGLHVLAGTLTDSSGKSGPFRIAFTVWSGSGIPPATEGNTSATSATTITSADGFASVTIPAGAWPTSTSDWIVVRITPSVNNTISNGFAPASEVVDVTAFWALSHQPVHRFNTPISIVLHATGKQIVPATDDGFGWRVMRKIPSGSGLPAAWDDGFAPLASAFDLETRHVTPFTLLKDVQAPLPPSHVRGVLVDGRLSLTWLPGADNSGTYDFVSVLANGSNVGQFGPDTTSADLGSLDQNASIVLRETDLSGNTSADTTLRAVPPLAGRPLTDVESALVSAGFRIGDIVEGSTGTTGAVTGPSNLLLAAAGDAIDLTVAPGTIAANTKFVFSVVSAKKFKPAPKRHALAARILLTRAARVNAILFSPRGVKLYTWRFSIRAGRSIVRLRLPSQVRRPGRYAIRWTARSTTDTATKTIRIRLVTSRRGLPAVSPRTGLVEVVLAGAQVPQVSVGGKRKPKVVTAAGVDNAFDLAGTGTGDVQVMVVDVDQFGVSFVRDLHVVFPNMRIVALSKSPKLLAAALKAGASVALPSSTPSPTLAAVIARLLEQP